MEPGSYDSRAFDSRAAGDSRAEYSKAEQASPLRGAEISHWISIKQTLKNKLSIEEWNLWVRPARLLKVLSGSCMLIAIPPNNRIVLAAKARQDMLHSCGPELQEWAIRK